MLCNIEPRKKGAFRKCLLLLLPALLAMQTAAAALPPAAEWIPKNAIISIQVEKPKALLDLFTGKDAAEAIASLPGYEGVISSPNVRELINLIGFIETTLETDWRTALAKITGGGITFAVCPDDVVLLIIDAEDEAMLKKAHDFFMNIARNDGKGGEVASVNGLTAWTFDGKEAHTIIANRYISASKPEGLKKVLELRAGTATDNITSKPAYQAAKAAAKPDSVATAFADLSLLKYIPELSALFNSSDTNPLSALAFAGILEALQDSSWLGLGIEVKDDGLVITASVDGKADDPASSA
ncbi:MAG: hypothetical protein ACYS8Z_01335, partial [Planctomycetota bacterium]